MQGSDKLKIMKYCKKELKTHQVTKAYFRAGLVRYCNCGFPQYSQVLPDRDACLLTEIRSAICT